MFDRETGDEIEATPPISAPSSISNNERCARCLTTWETLRREGRAGCPACYPAFRAALGEVMARVQRGPDHIGKTPRAAQKRGRRAENLRKRHDNQRELLHRRLQSAIANRNGEEAAALRAKIASLD